MNSTTGGYGLEPGLQLSRWAGPLALVVAALGLTAVLTWSWWNDDEPPTSALAGSASDPERTETEADGNPPSAGQDGEQAPPADDAATTAPALRVTALNTDGPTGVDPTATEDRTDSGPAGNSADPDPTAGDSSASTADSTPDDDRQETTTVPSASTTGQTSSTSGEPSTTRAPTTTTTPTTRTPTTAAPTTRTPTTRTPTTAAPTTRGGTCSTNAEFERVFRDDFNGSSLGGHWSQYNSPGNAGFGLRRPSAIAVSDGRLVMTARMIDGSLVSGGMSHDLAQTYGRYRVKVRTDNDPSQATSGVVLTWPQSQVHPRDGENNIYETLRETKNRNPFYTFIHKPFGSTSDQERFVHNADGAQYQVMTMDWTPDRITVTREGPGGPGREVHVVDETPADLIPDVPHRLTVQLDAWSHSMTGVVQMEVDWVEIYRYCG